MKKTLTSLLCLATAMAASAQVTQSYTTKSEAGTYTELTDGTVVATSEFGETFSTGYYSNDGAGLDIGFSFKYDNQLMTKFGIGAHGYIILGKEGVSTTGPKDPALFTNSSSTPDDVIGYCYRSLVKAIDETEISYKTTGEEGAHALTVQFKNLQIVADGWSGEQVRDTVSVQIRLDEATGNISFVTYGFEPDASVAGSMNYNDGFRIGLRGASDDVAFLGTTFDGPNLSNSGSGGFVSWRATSYPADGLTLTFVSPADCQTPTVLPTDLVATATSLSVDGSFTASSDADHYLVLLAEGKDAVAAPQNGTYYAKGDSIGTARVLGYSTDTTFASGDILSSAKEYSVYVYAANSFGFYGPKYATTPLTGSFTTAPAAPAALSLAATDSTKLVVNATANEAGNGILIAYTTEPQKNDWDQIVPGGLFGTPTGTYSAGDAIEGGGTVAYVGAAKDGIAIEGLQNSTVYHVKAWSKNAEGVYSSTNVTFDASTDIITPWATDFSKNAMSEAPEGWNVEGDWRVDYYTEHLKGTISEADGSNGKEMWVETPYAYLPEGTNRVVVNFLMTIAKGFMGRDPYYLNRKDVVKVQVTEDGQNYTDIATYDQNTLEFADTETPTKLFINFDTANGKKAKVRIYFKLHEAPTTEFYAIRLEHKSDCDYPVDVTVPADSIVGGSAFVTWTPQTDESQWDVRYKKSEDSEWSEPITVTDTTYTITGLEGMTAYDVQVRARASETKVSDWSETVNFTSGLCVPFSIDFTALESLSSSWESKTGVLATPTVLTDDTNWQFQAGWISNSLTYTNYNTTADDWFITPAIDLGDGTTCWYDLDFSVATNYLPTGTDATLQVVVARDGKTFNEADVLQTIKAEDMPEAYGEPKTFKQSLTNIKGTVRIGFYVHSTTAPFTFDVKTISIQANSDEPETPSAINAIDGETVGAKAYFTLDGKQLNAPVKGLNIVRTADGKTQKVVIR